MSLAVSQQQTRDEISNRNKTVPVPVIFQESLNIAQVLKVKREQISDDVSIFDASYVGFDDSNRGFDGTINTPVVEQVIPHNGVFYDNFRQTTFIDYGTLFGSLGLSFPISLAGSPTTATQNTTEGYFSASSGGLLATTSNGDDTFIFFDDFDRADSTDMGSKWTEYGTTDWQIKNNTAYLPDESSGRTYLALANVGGSLYTATDIIIESKIKIANITNSDAHLGITARANTATDTSHRGYTLTAHNYPNTLQLLDEETAWKASTTTSQALNEWWHFELQVDGDNMRGKSWKDGDSEPSSWMVQDTSTTMSSGYIGLDGFINGTTEQYYDWFFARKYTAVPPTYSIGSETDVTASNSLSSSGWSKKKPITLTNSGSSTITDYQIKIVVPYSPNMQSDFGDIRFMNSSETTELSYWIESQTDGVTATIWVKVDSIPVGDSNIYMYYHVQSYVVSDSIYMSSEIPTTVSFVSSALIGSGESVTFYISEDGGTNWTEIVSSSTSSSTRQYISTNFTLSNPTDVRWKASLIGSKIYNVKFKFT